MPVSDPICLLLLLALYGTSHGLVGALRRLISHP